MFWTMCGGIFCLVRCRTGVSGVHGCMVFFCKQKTAYEMRISDWSSDVCSSDLEIVVNGGNARSATLHWQGCADAGICYPPQTMRVDLPSVEKIGRASCRERVCQYV